MISKQQFHKRVISVIIELGKKCKACKNWGVKKEEEIEGACGIIYGGQSQGTIVKG